MSDISIEMMKTNDIIPYEFNSRQHDEEQINRLANSINEFGFNQPLVIDEKNILLVGHGRLMAAKKLNLEMVPVVKRLELTELKKKAYRILDNKLQNDSTWDFDNLEKELSQLKIDGLNVDDWGLENFLLNGDEPSDEEKQNVELSDQYRIEIVLPNESEQQRMYEKLTSEGIKCRLLTL